MHTGREEPGRHDDELCMFYKNVSHDRAARVAELRCTAAPDASHTLSYGTVHVHVLDLVGTVPDESLASLPRATAGGIP